MPEPTAGAPGHGVPGACATQRRVTVRYPSHLRGSCHTVHARQAAGWPAQFLNVSCGGLGLLLQRRFEPGTVLAVEPLDVNGGTSSVLLVRVIHATRRADGGWLLGCRHVTDLTEDEVQALR